MKREVPGKNFDLPQYSLHSRIQAFAKEAEGKEELWGKWKGRNTEILESRLYSADSGAPENTAEPAANNEGTKAIDILLRGLIRHNLERAVTVPVKTWPKGDLNLNRKAYKVTGGHLIRESKAVATTPNGLSGPLIKSELGKDSGDIWTLIDEASQDMEPDTWGPLKLAEVNTLEGMILAGDQEQLRPSIYSTTANSRDNIITLQLWISLLDRYISYKSSYISYTTIHFSPLGLINLNLTNHSTYAHKMKHAAQAKFLKLERLARPVD
ncbi:MAG: hypothetical protein Q9208_000017 [Pyrenodesmia sp. 3 TL-2023]